MTSTNLIHFELVTLDGTKFAQEVYEVILPTPEGYIGILPGHIPLISLASPGIISIRHNPGDRDDQMDYFATNGGGIEVVDNVVRVLVDEADHEQEINEQEAQKAFEHAQRLRTEAGDQVTIEKAQELMDRQAVRLQVAGLRHRKRR